MEFPTSQIGKRIMIMKLNHIFVYFIFKIYKLKQLCHTKQRTLVCNSMNLYSAKLIRMINKQNNYYKKNYLCNLKAKNKQANNSKFSKNSNKGHISRWVSK